MKDYNLLLCVAAALAFGCSARMPLDAVVETTPIKGQITVTVLNGTSPTAGVSVQVVAPNGSSQTETTASTLTAPGQAVFSEAFAGRYMVGIANQPSQAPNSVPVTLTVAQPYAAVSLHIGNGYLSVAAADGKGFCYDETQTFHTYTLTYVNPTNLQDDVTVLYNAAASTLPSGWGVSFNTTSLEAGQSTQMIVQTAPWTLFGNVTISLSALHSSAVIFSTPVVLMRKWQPVIDPYYMTNGCSSFWLDINFLCEHCTNSGDTVEEQVTDSRASGGGFDFGCSYSSGTQVLTDALTVPDGDGPQLATNVACVSLGAIGNSMTFTTTFQNNRSYTFTLGGGCSNWNQPVTITAGMGE